jgi:spermidine/putrescine transport system substrate-binding protein
MTDDLDRQFERLLRNPHTRRRLLQRGAAGALSASALAYLAACGTDEPSGSGDEASEAKAIPKGEIADAMLFANWPAYIDEERSALKSFQEKHGTEIKYVEEINDNTEFFGKVRQQYAQGQSGGRDIHVVTDWMAARMIRLGYVQKFDKSTMPTANKNLIERLKSPPFDPQREFSMPWQSGLTGIIYRKDLVKREPKSVDDLFDPAYKGKVTMLSEMRDFTGNEYIKDIPKGDSVVIFGWSGDAVQLKADNPNIEFVLPESGGMLWTDNMQIPVGAPHAFTAEKFIDYVYQPEVQAPIEAYINYICPVDGVKEVIEKTDKALAQNQLIFPDAAFLDNTHIFKGLNAEEEQQLDEEFQQVIGA